MTNLPHQQGLDIDTFTRLLDSTTNSYKHYWLWSIVDEVSFDHTIIPMKRLACRMIVKSWYYLSQNKLSFGAQDQLPVIVKYTMELVNFGAHTSEEMIVKDLLTLEDPLFLDKVKTLCRFAPYRLLSPFFNLLGIPDYKKNKAIVDLANEDPNSLYSFMDGNDKIRMTHSWKDYFFQNSSVIIDWIKEQLLEYLYRKNPDLSSISVQLAPLTQEELDTTIIKSDRVFLKNFVVRTVMFIESVMGSNLSFQQGAKCSLQKIFELEDLIAEVHSLDKPIPYGSEYFDLYHKKVSIVESYKKAILYSYWLDTDDDDPSSSFSEYDIKVFIDNIFHRINYSRGDLLSILEDSLEKSETGSIQYLKRGDNLSPYLCIDDVHSTEQKVEEDIEELPLKVEMELRIFLRQKLFDIIKAYDIPIHYKDLLQLFNLQCSGRDKLRFFLNCNIRGGEAGVLFHQLSKRFTSNLEALKGFLNTEYQYFLIIGEEVVALQEWKKDKKVFDAYVEILQRYFNEGYQVVEVLENVVQILKEEEKRRAKRS